MAEILQKPDIPRPDIPKPDIPKPDIPKKPAKKKGGWFQKIPREILFSPAGIFLMFFAAILEIIDWIPGAGADTLTWELLLEIIFIIFLMALVKDISKKSLIIPFFIERIPGLSDILPTWLLKFFF
ncbi:MAG: hypothetical protein Q8P63_02655 [Candidatus Nealsonbacteria bacterium]|nr:hypothetical protein [Candidatus Nealsonbacteria bacterium]